MKVFSDPPVYLLGQGCVVLKMTLETRFTDSWESVSCELGAQEPANILLVCCSLVVVHILVLVAYALPVWSFPNTTYCGRF